MSTANSITDVAMSVRNPARENVTITPATLSSIANAATARAAEFARGDHQRGGDRDDQVEHQRQVVRVGGDARAAHVAGDALQAPDAGREHVARQVVIQAGRRQRNGAQHQRPRDRAQPTLRRRQRADAARRTRPP